MTLFLRLWLTRHRYEQMRPFGRAGRDAAHFHLRQLQALWHRVLAYQKALGLDVSPFTPREYFEAIYIISGYAQREVESSRNAAFEMTARWREYAKELGALSHEINPFEFSDMCARCLRIIDELCSGTLENGPEEKLIPMPQDGFDIAKLGRAALF